MSRGGRRRRAGAPVGPGGARGNGRHARRAGPRGGRRRRRAPRPRCLRPPAARVDRGDGGVARRASTRSCSPAASASGPRRSGRSPPRASGSSASRWTTVRTRRRPAPPMREVGAYGARRPGVRRSRRARTSRSRARCARSSAPERRRRVRGRPDPVAAPAGSRRLLAGRTTTSTEHGRAAARSAPPSRGRAASRPVWPRVPTTTVPVPRSAANRTISPAGSPSSATGTASTPASLSRCAVVCDSSATSRRASSTDSP